MVGHESAPSVKELLELRDDELAASSTHPGTVVFVALEALLLLGMIQCLNLFCRVGEKLLIWRLLCEDLN